VKQAEEQHELEQLLAREASPLGDSLVVLKQRGPDATELASLASRLQLQGIEVTTQPGSPSAPLPKKWLIGGAGGVVAVLLWLGLRPTPPAPYADARSPARASTELIAPPIPVPAPLSQGSPLDAHRRGSATLSESARAPAPESGAPSTAAAPEPATARTAAPAADVAAPSMRSSLLTTSSAAPTPATPSATAPASVPSAQGLGAPSEIELLRDARFALKQSPARALELTDEHARRYARGKLVQERELIAISALVALGRRTAALSRGANFERAFPQSPYREQVSDLLQ
jgi:hypothetical protein